MPAAPDGDKAGSLAQMCHKDGLGHLNTGSDNQLLHSWLPLPFCDQALQCSLYVNL